MFYVYILESIKYRTWYIGYTKDIENRIIKHNRGDNYSTKAKRPWKLIYYEAYLNKYDALGRERFLKSGAGHRFIKKQIRNYLN